MKTQDITARLKVAGNTIDTLNAGDRFNVNTRKGPAEFWIKKIFIHFWDGAECHVDYSVTYKNSEKGENYSVSGKQNIELLKQKIEINSI